ncbi:MAG: DUF5667 domain-containing protein [archaeon]
MFAGKTILVVFLMTLLLLLAPGHASDSPGSVFIRTPSILPGSILYPAKLSLEHFSVAFSFSGEARASRILFLADGRLSEINALLALNRTEGLQKILAEYTFLLDSYYQLPVTETDFSRHARNIQILEDYVDKSVISEANRLTFSIIVASIRRAASKVGTISPRDSLFSSARLDAERDLRVAEKAVEELGFFSEREASSANETLRTAETLLEAGECVSASLISRKVYSEASARIAFFREPTGSLNR